MAYVRMITTTPGSDERQFAMGEPCFDAARSDILSDPLIVVEAEAVPLRSLPREDYTAVKYNERNKELNGGDALPEETSCVKCAYIYADDGQPGVSNSNYTFPTFRLKRIRISEDRSLPSFRPPTLTAAKLIQHLETAVEDGGINSREDLQVALMEADLDGEVIAAAVELAERDSDW